WSFACRWADPSGTIAGRYAPHFHFSDEPQTPFAICLRHVASEQHPGTERCVFLAETAPDADAPLGRGGCGVYDHRPSACRCFPTKFDTGGDLTVLYDIPARGRDGDHPVHTLCPREWTVDDVDPIQAPADLAVARYEMDFFRSIAGVWNRTPRAFDLFPDFVRLVYSRRVVDPREGDDMPATIPLPHVRDMRNAA
ncbi:MAG: YkgJ family cysteine cluster protein, partial [Planctomycetota bacterium]